MEFEKAKQILNNKETKKYNNKEVKEIIELLNVLADVCISNLLKEKTK